MRSLIAFVFWCVASISMSAEPPLGVLHPDPKVPDARFKPHQLPFELPTDGVARDEFRSERFYAVLLASLPPCTVTEEQRVAIQAQFPDRKVFAQRCDCEEEETITYTNVRAGVGFIAVYAGLTAEEAKAVL